LTPKSPIELKKEESADRKEREGPQMWRALCAVAALAVARAEVYDEDDAAAAPVATNLGSALEFLGDGPTGGATGADGGAAAVRDATGTIEALEGVVGTGGTGAATGGAPSATGGTEVERKIPRLFPEVAFPPESDPVPAVNGSAFCGRAETCIDCTAMVGCGFDSDAYTVLYSTRYSTVQYSTVVLLYIRYCTVLYTVYPVYPGTGIYCTVVVSGPVGYLFFISM
jgi:hypothetical protein